MSAAAVNSGTMMKIVITSIPVTTSAAFAKDARLGELLGADGALYAYSDDVYLVSNTATMSVALTGAPAIFRKVGLRIG